MGSGITNSFFFSPFNGKENENYCVILTINTLLEVVVRGNMIKNITFFSWENIITNGGLWNM